MSTSLVVGMLIEYQEHVTPHTLNEFLVFMVKNDYFKLDGSLELSFSTEERFVLTTLENIKPLLEKNGLKYVHTRTVTQLAKEISWMIPFGKNGEVRFGFSGWLDCEGNEFGWQFYVWGWGYPIEEDKIETAMLDKPLFCKIRVAMEDIFQSPIKLINFDYW